MKIVYVYTALTTVGGADRIITQKANYLADVYGHEVFIITDSQNGRPLSFPLSAKVKHLDLGIDFGRQYGHNLLVRYFIYRSLMMDYRTKLEECLNNIKPDITISTLGRDLDFLTNLKDGSCKVGESHISRTYVRNLHLMEAKGGIYKWVANFWRKRQEKAVRQLDAFVVLTEADARNWNNVRPSVIIPNATTLRTDNCSKCSSKQIISIGRLNEQKGYDLLIQAWKTVAQRHPDWSINIYGEGELYHNLQKEIGNYGLEKQIHLCKPVTNIIDKYTESAFYVMSSRFEGFGLVLTEAMSCGLPCISFDCPSGPSEIISDKEDGLLIENGNVEALAEGICYLMEHKDERIQMGMKAKENVRRYAPEQIMKQWDKLFSELIQKRS